MPNSLAKTYDERPTNAGERQANILLLLRPSWWIRPSLSFIEIPVPEQVYSSRDHRTDSNGYETQADFARIESVRPSIDWVKRLKED